MRHVHGSDMHQRFLILHVESQEVFSVQSVRAFARSVLRTLIDPNPLAVSLWNPCYTWQLFVVWGRVVVEYCGPRDLVLDGQSVSRDTDPEYRPQERE